MFLAAVIFFQDPKSMTPPDARVLIGATLIVIGVAVAVHEYRIHAHHLAHARDYRVDSHLGWGAASSGEQGVRSERSSGPEKRPDR